MATPPDPPKDYLPMIPADHPEPMPKAEGDRWIEQFYGPPPKKAGGNQDRPITN